MMYVQCEVRQSGIFGKGLFATAPIRKATIVCFFPIGAEVITEAQFLEAVKENRQPTVRTATRYAGLYYTCGNEKEPYTYLNHSFEPNLLCHCGVIIARRDISAGEEMTLDYRTLIDDTDVGIYRDAVTGREIRGFSARQTMLRTAREMMELIESVDECWDGRGNV